MSKRSTVTIIGRPNVGKSCLFNRLIGRRRAIVEKSSGVTRDRIHAAISWQGKDFLLIDTGGLVFKGKRHLSDSIYKQTKAAVGESGLILLVVDAQTGLNADDYAILEFLRKSGRKIILVVNKVDDMSLAGSLSEFYKTGLDEIFFVSALHGLNIDELLDVVAKDVFPPFRKTPLDEAPLKVALIGRPNSGKSSFFNMLLKEDRVIISEEPGTTRDSIDTILELPQGVYKIIDTAGLKQKKKNHAPLEFYSRSRSLEAIKHSDVCIVLIDAQVGICRDDLHIFKLITNENKCCVIAVNKCDLVKISLKDCIYTVAQKAPFVNFAFCVLCSAKTGKNLHAALGFAEQAWINFKRKVKQRKLSATLAEIIAHKEKQSGYAQLKLHFLTQVKTKPPTFVLIVNRPELVKTSFLRFIENRIRRCYNFKGTPIKIYIKRKKRAGK